MLCTEELIFVKIKTWHVLGTIFTIVFGSILHFVYEWSGFHPLFGLIGAVNESVWEHLKLLYWPFLISLILELWIYGKDIPGFFASKARGIVCGMLFIVFVYYTYTGVVGKNLLLVDGMLFVIGAVVSFVVSYKNIKNHSGNPKKSDFWGMAVLLTLTVMFCIYSFNPPNIGIFWP